MAKYPASTVQILGAEKALFRALKTKGNTPKYGLIYHSTLSAVPVLSTRVGFLDSLPTNVLSLVVLTVSPTFLPTNSERLYVHRSRNV